MIPGPLYVPHRATGREDRASSELRAYLREEYKNTGIDWLLSQVRGRREPLGRRLLAWIRLRRSEASAGQTAVQPEGRTSVDVSQACRPGPAAIPTETREEQVPVDDCEHAERVALGSGGGTSYSRCYGCGGVLVMREGRVWRIPPELGMKPGAESPASAAIEQGADRIEKDTLVEA